MAVAAAIFADCLANIRTGISRLPLWTKDHRSSGNLWIYNIRLSVMRYPAFWLSNCYIVGLPTVRQPPQTYSDFWGAKPQGPGDYWISLSLCVLLLNINICVCM